MQIALNITEVYEQWFHLVVAQLVSRFRFSEDDALDVASHVFYQAFYGSGKRIDLSRGDAALGWLMKRAEFRALDLLRSRKRHKAYEDDVQQRQRVASGSSGKSKNRTRLIHALPPELKSICELMIEGYRAKEIAEITNKSENQVRYLQRRLNEMLPQLAAKLGLKKNDLFD